MATPRRYVFSWDLLGNLALGRPNLGPTTRLEVYRLMQFTFRDVIERRHGTEEADRIFYEAGKLAGTQFYANVVQPVKTFPELVARLQTTLSEMGIGVLRVEREDVARGSFVITVSEDLDCSGMPEIDTEVCVFDEGFIAGIMESFSGRAFRVKEVDCWCTGERTCRFTVETERT